MNIEIFIYAVRDKAADSFLNPFVAVNDAVAIRQFAAAFGDDRTVMGSNPGDFELHLLGVFNTETGEINPVPDKIIDRGENHAV